MADDILKPEQQARLDELYKLEERTEEENAEFESLKKERKDRTQKRINQLSYEKNKERERAEDAERRLQELEAKQSRATDIPTPPKVGEKETVTIGDKQYYTFETLQSMVAAGEITDAKAYNLNDERIAAQAEERAFNRLQETTQKQSEETTRKNDVKKILSEYPHFDKNHIDHDPNDPLYKEATRLWQNGYRFDPEGFSKSINDAKRILGLDKPKPDVSNDLSVNRGDRFGVNEGGKQTDVNLSTDEKEAAYRMYVMGGIINPRTGRVYTEAEAQQKAKKAKLARMR